MSQASDILARTGFRWLSDIDHEPGPDKVGARIFVGPQWCAYLMKRYPHLFINEAVMHLIDEDAERSKK